MADRRPRFADFDDAYARGSRPSVVPRVTGCHCERCRPRIVLPEPPTQAVAPTLRSIVSAAVSLIEAITARKAER